MVGGVDLMRKPVDLMRKPHGWGFPTYPGISGGLGRQKAQQIREASGVQFPPPPLLSPRT